MAHGAKERRRSIRLRPGRAKAVCSTRQIGGVYEVQDLSRGGVLLEGAPLVPPGTKVSVRVMLPGVESLLLAGRVLRTAPGPHTDTLVAVRFSAVTADAEDSFADLVAREWSKVCAPRCIIASSSLQVRMEMAHRITEAGAKATRASTPIELIHRLEAVRDRLVVVFLGTTLGGCTGTEIASFLATAYPSVRRVLLQVSRNPEGSLPAQHVHAVLSPPWTTDLIKTELQKAREAVAKRTWAAAG